MKNLYAILALSAVVGVVGCQSTDQNNTTAANDNVLPPNNAGSLKVNQKMADTNGGNMSRSDRQFVTSAGEGGAYEVQAGELALTKSSDSDIRIIAQHMVDDHKKANEELAAIVQRKNAVLPVDPSVEQAKMITQLSQLSGSEFDREYMRQQRQAHQDTIALFENEANNGNDRDMRTFATDTLPALRSHLDMINNHMRTAVDQ